MQNDSDEDPGARSQLRTDHLQFTGFELMALLRTYEPKARTTAGLLDSPRVDQHVEIQRWP